ncbi:putative DNA cytosine methyltransferase [Pseudomonas phage UAntarctica]|nr:putative DNA cytosine methyltransferase [Pseudomonas phage UAntarctica]
MLACNYPEPALYRWKAGLVADNFAGGGGASTGIAQAIGQSPDIAVNHNAEALMMHEENHPTTKHYNESVWDIDIHMATAGSPLLFGWFSPDCTHFSVAKGGKPVKKEIRGLAWIVKKWAGQADMAVLFMENVKEFLSWGPLIAKRCKTTKRVIKLVADPVKKDKSGSPVMNEVVSEPGEYVPYRDQALVPDKKRAGKTFKQFIQQLRAMGYEVEWKKEGLVASDFGDPTTRTRFFLMARKDGLPITWPEPTHGNPKLLKVQANKLKPWKTAGDNLDFSIPCPSIFEEGRRPLAENTLRRIAKGIQKFVIDAGDDAFLVKANHGGDEFRGQSLDDPLQTITSKLGTGLTAVSLTKFNQNSIGQAADQPIDTIMAGATRFGAVAAHLVPTGYGEREGQAPRTHSMDEPIPTLVGTNKFAVVETTVEPVTTQEHVLGALRAEIETGFIATIDHTSTGATATGMDSPIGTVTSKARHVRVAALLKHFTGVVGQDMHQPLPTITARDHNSVMEATAVHIQRDFGNSVGHSAGEPLAATTAGGGGHSALVASSLVKLKGSCQHGQPLDRPIDTIAAQGNHFAQVQSFLVKFFGTGTAVTLDAPLDTITAKPRFGLVTIHGELYQIVDIGMRMLEPHELYRCQGFPADYRHEVVMGNKLAKHKQVRMVGNSVPPGLARALVAANIPLWALNPPQAMRA